MQGDSRLRAAFDAVVVLPDEEREAALHVACDGDADLIRRVRELLDADRQVGGFLEHPCLIRDGQPHDLRIEGYEILTRLGSGGFGTVYRARQLDPDREVAIKVLHSPMSDSAAYRFRIESGALATLQHPSVAMIHGSGQTESGHPYLVMELVEGRPLTRYCDENRMTVRGRLELFVRVCEAVQHAHQRGIVHRDLKPSNVLVTEIAGQPFVKIIDFGIAKFFGDDASKSGTIEGQVLGTPEYMSPEQARGEQTIDTRSDVYSLGAVLYEMLTGRPPFDSKALRANHMADLRRVLEHDMPVRPSARVGEDSTVSEARSTTITDLQRSLREDLDWVVLMALRKDREDRYPSVAGLADDVTRFLENVPVVARAPSSWYLLRKMVQRHRRRFVAVAFVAVSLIAGLIGTSAALWWALAEREEATRAEARATRESEKAASALAVVLPFADKERLARLEARAADLWPAVPARADDMREWLVEASDILERRPQHEAALAHVRARALPYDAQDATRDRETHPRRPYYERQKAWLTSIEKDIVELEGRISEHDPTAVVPPEDETGPHVATLDELQAMLSSKRAYVVKLRAEIEDLESAFDERRTWLFGDVEDERRHALWSDLATALAAFQRRVDDVRERLDLAGRIVEESMTGPLVSQAWQEAVADIRSLPAYGGLVLQPQVGLVPLRRDPQSGLWEFWSVASGERPVLDADPASPSPWRLGDKTGIILVLIPGGTFTLGAQSTDPDGVNYDPHASVEDGPPYEVQLEPYFISRYEMTQGQWLFLTGDNPSLYVPRHNFGSKQLNLRHPVEQVTWDECVDVSRRIGLQLPTMAQWEVAARGGTSTPWWTGAEASSLAGTLNIADRFARLNGSTRWNYQEWLYDGYTVHAPVGSFRPNPFGLHDVYGNVFEWCRDRFGKLTRYGHSGPGAEHMVPFGDTRCNRGGNFSSSPEKARAAYRVSSSRDNRFGGYGVRLARPVDAE